MKKSVIGILSVLIVLMLSFTACSREFVDLLLPNKASEGLEFVSNSDGSCIVTGLGTCEDRDVVIPNKSPTGDYVTSIGDYAFDHCTGLTSITIPDSVTSIGEAAFFCCTDLTSITIPNGVTSVGEGVFAGCTELTSINVDADNPVYHSSSNCLIETASKNLIAVCQTSVIPSDGSVTSIGRGAFAHCYGLTSITVPDSVTSIGEAAFFCCTDLTSITMSDSVTSIGDGAFAACSRLTSITIPNGLTNIGVGTFLECPSLTSATIPDSVKSIGSSAFEGCTGLTDVYYFGTEEEWAAITIGSDNEHLTNATIHYNWTGEES